LMYITVFLSLVLVIGLGIAFFGLAYHHHRRWYEHQRVTEEHEEKRPSRNRSSAK
jgi:cytochrome b subunit of formate dehydrogenase